MTNSAELETLEADVRLLVKSLIKSDVRGLRVYRIAPSMVRRLRELRGLRDDVPVRVWAPIGNGIEEVEVI